MNRIELRSDRGAPYQRQKRRGARSISGVSDACLHELFEAIVDRSPDALALLAEDEALTYMELEQRANQLARYIRLRAPLSPSGGLCGVYFERGARPIIAILACLKAGAAYVPLDPAHPDDRLKYILRESRITLLLTEGRLAPRAAGLSDASVIDIDAAAPALAEQASRRLLRAETGVTPQHLCYVIYTSGTSGRPKGVMTEHRGASAFVRAWNAACRPTPQDRVFQGFMLGFDGSVEEIWMAFSNGAALVVGGSHTPRFGDDLAEYLARREVSYFSTVPTVLSTITRPVPTLRLLVLSGEVCPRELVSRWARPGLRLLNVYGPTEATVNTTLAECAPDRPVTIGRPLRGYQVHILDASMKPVPDGEKGELYIGGETLARGYINQPELTAQRFLDAPHITNGLTPRLYRTGDLVRRNKDGDLEFHGRIDDQIKIRGYRVELAEIESVLLEQPAIRAASVKLTQRDGLQCLAAYVVTGPSPSREPIDRAALVSTLQARLPSYMIPRFLDVVDELPTLASGKVDRSRLPEPTSVLAQAGREIIEPASELEAKIAAAWAEGLGVPRVSTTDDFFVDLGGYSLIAAQMVTLLHRAIGRRIAVRDIYQYPTVKKLAAYIASLPANDAELASEKPQLKAKSSRAVFESVPRWTRLLTTTLQALSMYVLSGILAIPFATFFLLLLSWLQGRVAGATLAWCVAALMVFTWPVMLALSIAAKWIIIGRYKPGAYPLWSLPYFRHWLAGRMQALSGVGALVGTPVMPLYFRLMGAKVGRRCTLASAHAGAWDLLSIGDDTSICADTQYAGYRVEDGMLLVGRVDIGSRCFVGIHSALGLNVRMEDDARLDDQSLLPDGQTIPAGEAWRGSPGKPDHVPVPPGEPIQTSSLRRAMFGLAHVLLVDVMAIVFLLPAVPVLVLLGLTIYNGGGPIWIASLVASIPADIFVYCLFIAAVKRALLSRAEPGVYRVDSAFYLRKWLADGVMGASRAALLPLYTTIYLPPWLRLVGAKIGARAELSTVWAFAPELIDVGEESFFADGSIIGGKRFFGGRFAIAQNRVGRRSFVGNSAVLPVGAGLGDRCLLGVQSIPPAGTPRTDDGTEWLGSPAFALPNRPKLYRFSDEVTYRPTKTLYFQRGVIDALRILIPAYMGFATFVVGVSALYFTFIGLGAIPMLALAPIIGITLSFGVIFAVCLLKRLVMGTFEPVIKPLWSPYVWLNEMINGAFESLMAPALLPYLGTPFVAPFLRLIGCKIGRHTYIESTLFSEFDLVHVGDYAALNAGSVIQTHLFEDRIMKSSRVVIGEGCSVGNMAIVLYDAEMGSGSSLGPLSLVMKGESLAPLDRRHGIPTVQAADAPPGIHGIHTMHILSE